MTQLECPVAGCKVKFFYRWTQGESKREFRSRVSAHVRRHWLKQFTMPVFLWRRDTLWKIR